jgi:hypothetical protein
MKGVYNIPGRSQQIKFSSTILFVREAFHAESDYEVLLLKRNDNIFLGGWYCYPGGNLDRGDYYEKWEEAMPAFMES